MNYILKKINLKNQLKTIKGFIFQNGRLLERKLFSCFFENGNIDDVIKALAAYQNIDGGFGNGIEPDLLCPNSSAIGAETAMFVLDLLDFTDNEITERLANWIIEEQNEEGYITHPPKNMHKYPFQEWWDRPDNLRILAISGFLQKWGYKDSIFFKKVRLFYSTSAVPKEVSFYEYPYFIYLKYLGKSSEEKQTFQQIINQLPSIFEQNMEHYPLFGRHWYHAIDILDSRIVKNEADNFFKGLQDDGGLKIIYQNLPHWRPIWTLDGLILLKKSNIIDL